MEKNLSAQSRIMRLPEVSNLTGLPRSSIYAKIDAGQFPEPIGLGSRSVGWLSDEVQKWLSDRISKSRGE